MTNAGDDRDDMRYQALVAAEVKAQLAGLDWTIEQLGNRARINKQQVERYLRLERHMRIGEFQSIALALGLTVEELSARARTWEGRLDEADKIIAAKPGLSKRRRQSLRPDVAVTLPSEAEQPAKNVRSPERRRGGRESG